MVQLIFTLTLFYMNSLSNCDVANNISLARRVYQGVGVDIEAYPHAVFLHLSISSCGGSLINSQSVLTAAHCLDDLRIKKIKIYAFLGSTVPRWSTTVRKVVDYVIHPNHNEARSRSNLAVTYLNSRVVYDQKIRRIAITWHTPTNQFVYSAGWGKQILGRGGVPLYRSLRETKQLPISFSTCMNLTGFKKAPNVMCTVPVRGSHASTDAGSGLLIKKPKRLLVAVLSSVTRDRVSVYTSLVANRDWIEGAVNLMKNRMETKNDTKTVFADTMGENI